MVMVIGRKRSMQASKIASSGPLASRRSASIAKSIIRIAFFLTMPMSRMIPMRAMTERSFWVMSSASSAPTPADGSVERIVIGWMRLS